MAIIYVAHAKKDDTTRLMSDSYIADKAEILLSKLKTDTFSYRFVLEPIKPIQNYIGLCLGRLGPWISKP
jgi:Txe/YoeB family toxin of Txe-Axe toxin-antitoxin module